MLASDLSIGVVIVHYRTPATTAGLLGDLIKGLDPERDAVAVVDNCSTENEFAELRTQIERHCRHEGTWRLITGDDVADRDAGCILLAASPQNEGYARGIKRGMRALASFESSVDVAWILNSDTRVSEQSVEALRSAIALDRESALWGTALREASGVHYGGRHLIGLDLPLGYLRRPPAAYGVKYGLARYPSGASFVIRLSSAEVPSLLPDYTFLYYEELALVRRLVASSQPMRCLPDVVIEHLGAVSTGSDVRRSDLTEYYSSRSALSFLQSQGRVALIVGGAFRLARRSILLSLRRQFGCLRPLARAYMDFARGHPMKWGMDQEC